MELEIKICRKCGESSTTKPFRLDKRRPGGVLTICRACERDVELQAKYGCTRTEYDTRMATSNSCEICGDTETLVHDHCHGTGAFRGVLCRGCNASIGQLGDTPEALLKAYNYLKDT